MCLQSEVKKTKKKIGLLLAALALLLLCTACAVKGNPLPKGMEEDAVLSAGLGVMDQLIRGEYDEVYEELRSDVRDATTASALEDVMDTATDGTHSPSSMVINSTGEQSNFFFLDAVSTAQWTSASVTKAGRRSTEIQLNADLFV